MQIFQVATIEDLDTVEDAIRTMYGCEHDVPCSALNTASYFLFRITCEQDITRHEHSDLVVTLPWPDLILTLTAGFVTMQLKRPLQNLKFNDISTLPTNSGNYEPYSKHKKHCHVEA